jgi:hypothetical protein
VVVDERRCLAPGGASVLKVADQLAFLCVDADDREAGSGEGLARGGDVVELVFVVTCLAQEKWNLSSRCLTRG